jgi:hypothetical protein
VGTAPSQASHEKTGQSKMIICGALRHKAGARLSGRFKLRSSEGLADESDAAEMADGEAA